jgi:ubiquinone/menaquinone biosynthesis C-methylase UbiE
MNKRSTSSAIRTELEYRERQLSGDIDYELKKSMAKIQGDGRLKNLSNLQRIGIGFYGKVLELGAGSCWFSSEISKIRSVEAVYALELSKSLLTRIAPLIMKRLQAKTNKIQRISGDFHELPFKENFFDMIVMDAALHHAVNPTQVLHEVKRVLKDQGFMLAIREPVLPLWRRGQKNIIGAEERSQGVTENVFTLSEWKRIFIRSGLKTKFRKATPTHSAKADNLIKKALRFLFLPMLNKYLFGYYYFLAEKESPGDAF